jgi:hypothetical protein
MGLIGRALNSAISSSELQAALSDILQPAGPAPVGKGRYDLLIDAANRLPRPALAFGVIAMFLFAMIDPTAFSQRMVALKAAPDELWWILGAVIATHFGAREAYHMRHPKGVPVTPMPETSPPEPPA